MMTHFVGTDPKRTWCGLSVTGSGCMLVMSDEPTCGQCLDAHRRWCEQLVRRRGQKKRK